MLDLLNTAFFVNYKNKFYFQSNGYGVYGDLERIRQSLELIAIKHKSEVDSSELRYSKEK